MKKVIPYIVIVLLLVWVIYLLVPGGTAVTKTSTSTSRKDTVRDTIKVPSPASISSTFKKKVTQKLADVPNDSTPSKKGNDSVSIPISQKVYSGDAYKAYASGYRVTLDSLQLYPKNTTTTITKVVTVTKNRSRWNLGISAGYGISKTGLTPYIGVGINYRLW
jgi:hypothetical protein